ncbi:penicillin-binding protein [Lujinxingia litoralis]|uniref:Penicillin-binding protein n=1 Tax=Lujinxingia litoralis TaxID=2211119 RepID=A0A328C964_9DELT|nr:penicillin-binding transpeptidase domain-containing protein [Lujinxingia litoralis]RAL23478.1 penicillin-binding protein [Lujinxingia litoralis]
MHHVDDPRERLWLKTRFSLVAAFFSLGFVAVGARVYYLQTVESRALQERAAIEWNEEVTRQARRGDILDRNGAELAVSVEVPSIHANPRKIENPELVARSLAPHLKLSFDTLVARLSRDASFVWLERQTNPSAAEAIRELKLSGVHITKEYKRYYPLREIAGQLIGFVGIDGEGLEGLERQLDSTLAGGTYQMRVTRDAQGRAMLLSDAPSFGEFEGHSVRLTIDEKIQRVAEQALAEQVTEFEAKGGWAVAMDVHTGDILALANTPSFDPNRFREHVSADWRLRAVTDTFEPGSVFKPFVLAAALQEQATTLDKSYELENGRMQIGRNFIRDTKRRESLTSAEIMQVSSNIGSYKIAQEIGRDLLYDYIRAFGFGQRTDVALRGEQAGLLRRPDSWAEITFANISFGHGLTTTPLQLAAGTAALANGGMLMKPRIIDAVLNRDGEVVEREEPTLVRRVVSEEAAAQTAWAMSLVTIPGGTGTRAAIPHVTVAGKTGTAQKVNPETRRYDPDLWIAGFMGFAPAEEPDVAVVVFIDEPQKSHYGGKVAGPAFAKITAEALRVRGVLPLAPEDRFQLEEEPPAALDTQVAPPAPEHVVTLPTMRVLDIAEDEVAHGQLPNFQELTLRQAVDRARGVGVVPDISGWGRVVHQDPPAGTPLEEVAHLELALAPGGRHGMLAREPSTGGKDQE